MSSQVDQDMTEPMSHYFIYTGHNSYLTGNQLNSASCDVPIIKALRRGVRVIELDIWPDSSSRKAAICVKHGWITTPVDFLTYLRSIKEHAFATSPYPVVITLEDHLTADLQAKAAQMLTRTFGDVLYCLDLDTIKKLPSPKKLKHRVIISTKPPKEYLEEKTQDIQNNQSSRNDYEGSPWDDEPILYDTDDHEDNDKSFDIDIHSQSAANFDEPPDQKINVSPDYKGHIAIYAGKPKGGLNEALKVEADKVRRLSLSEQGLEKAAKSHGVDVVRDPQLLESGHGGATWLIAPVISLKSRLIGQPGLT